MAKEPEFPEGLERITLGMLRGAHRQLAEEIMEYLPEEYAAIIRDESSVLELCRISEQLQRNKRMSRKAAKKMGEFVIMCNQSLEHSRTPPAQRGTEPQPAGDSTRIFKKGPYGAKLGPDELPALTEKQASAKTQTQKLVGVERIFIELETNPTQAKVWAEWYTQLVQAIANVLREGLEVKPHEEERFITEIWGIMTGNLHIVYGENQFGFLHESLDSGNWDCDNSSFLVFDVARELGTKVEMVIVPGHAFIATENFFFETTAGRYFPIEDLPKHYPDIRFRTSDNAKIEAMAFFSLENAYSRLGDEAMARGNVPEAGQCYDKAIWCCGKMLERVPEDSYTYVDRARVHSKKKDYAEALKDCAAAIEQDPKNASAHTVLSVVYMDGKELDKALDECSIALRLDPGWWEAYSLRGAIFLMKGEFEMAIVECSNALQVKENANVYRTQALAYLRVSVLDHPEYPDRAIEDLARAVQLEPESAETHFLLGGALYIKGEFDRSIASYNEAIRLRPDYTEAYLQRGTAREENGDPQGAGEDREMAARLKEAVSRK